MINEELKTFVDKMRAAGKNDTEIAAELKTAGWDEAAIGQELKSKTRFNFGKMKFWIWLYGMAVLLFLTTYLVAFLFGSTFLGDIIFHILIVIFMIYIFGIVPVTTLFAIGLKSFFGILKLIPNFKDSKSPKQLDHKWLLVITNAITGAIMLGIGYSQLKIPDIGMAALLFALIAVSGGILLILSLIFTGILLAVKKIKQRNKIRL